MNDARPSGRYLLLAALVLVIAAACNPGQYPIDVFQEMHYTDVVRRLAPERVPPPSESVPVTGRMAAYTFEQAGELANPVPRSPEAVARADELYRVNCATCHGAQGDGRGIMAGYFTAAGFVPPVDLDSERVRNRTDGELLWIMTYGLSGMPPFGELLREEEIWLLVHHIREVQGQ